MCEKCQSNKATIHFQLNINGQQQTMHLCSECYKKEKEKIDSFMKNPFIHNSFGNFQQAGGFQQMWNDFAKQQKNRIQTVEKGNSGFLDQFGRNLNEAAKAGQIDPVIGRDKEIKRTIEILNRRNKNNPVLIGEPGVGKTAIAEGLALKIVQKDVPAKLKDKEVYLLDVASLVANTGIRGQFEERMKQLIHELQQRKNIILFIDEIHLLVGAGSAEGSMDAGNILKPALARGELQVIGATTLKEYRIIEKDAALERRFQPILIEEPTIEDTIKILNGLKDRYEQYHQVQYSDRAIEACAVLSARYIQDRYLPDKAIDLMDEAGSKLNLQITDSDQGSIQKRLEEIAHEKQQALSEENYELAAQLRDEENKLLQTLKENPKTTTFIVDEDLIHEIISEKTGIPVGKLQQDEQNKLKELEQNLASKVIGQEEAVRKVAKAIRRGRAGLKAKNRPIGSFLFVGPTGVGKTELSKVLAEELFGTRDAVIRLDMSEYMEKHSVSKLIGSPPGYVGHEEGGQLTEKVRRNPYCLILVDEIEKAHPDVQHIFLQILEDGRLTDSQGRVVSFKESVIIMTSNAGTGEKRIQVGFGKSEAIKEANLLDTLGDFFKPEFLNRFDAIIEFNHLTKEDLLQILNLQLKELESTLQEQNMTLTVTDDVKEKLVEQGYQPELGARPLRRVIQVELEDKIADYILDFPEHKHLQTQLKNDQILIIPKL